MSKTFVVSALVIAVLASESFSWQSTDCPCNEEVTAKVARVYVLAAPLVGNLEELKVLLEENSSLFQENGEATICLRLLAETCVSGAIRSYAPGDYDRAYGRVLEMGATGDQARQAASNLTQGSVDLFAMGHELWWLSEVLPAATRDDWYPFHTTGTPTRNQIRQVIPLVEFLGSFDAEFAQMLQITVESLRAFEPLTEFEIMTIAAMTCQE